MTAAPDYTDFDKVAYRGATVEIGFQTFSDALLTTPLAFSSLSEIWATLKVNTNLPDTSFLQKTKTLGGIVAIDGPNGIAKVVIDPADTAALPSAITFLCDIKLKETSGREDLVLRGKVTILPTPTNAIA